MSVESLFIKLKSEALPGIWAKGLGLAREKSVILDAQKPDETVIRVSSPGQLIASQVSLWPEDDDAHCDCGSKLEVCAHVIASIIALKNGWLTQVQTAKQPVCRLVYRFSSKESCLNFERVIVRSTGQETILLESLVSYLGGIESGRIAAPVLPTTREDLRLDQALSELTRDGVRTKGSLDRNAIIPIFDALKNSSTIEFNGRSVQINVLPLKVKALLEDTPRGIRLTIKNHESPLDQVEFTNGALYVKGVLRPTQTLSSVIREFNGEEFLVRDFPIVVGRLLPILEKETELEVKTKKLPRVEKMAPRLVLEMEQLAPGSENLEVMPRLVYGNPIVAEVIDGRISFVESRGNVKVPERDERQEQILVRELQQKLLLKPRQRVLLEGIEGIKFLESMKKEFSDVEALGGAAKKFTIQGDLVPKIEGSAEGLTVTFNAPSGAQADLRRVLKAWREGDLWAPLLSGGWANIPEEWINRNIDRLEALLGFRATLESKKKLTPLEQIQIAEFCAETGGALSADLTKLRDQLIDFRGIPDQKLPADLTATLRPYQKLGINWLGCLRQLGLGAILADDMGLGKTLQAICAIKGKTLIVAPTSVLPSWEEQIKGFRPQLKTNVYYGQARKFSTKVDITLTSYGVLRSEKEMLISKEWDTIVVDEAQQIKNPDSQVAKAAHELKGKFKIALSGTPIENRITDLWSQFQFVQPGLLGPKEDFVDQWQMGHVERLKRKIRPLILRRMKTEVAPELPPKTETILYSTFNAEEQKCYDTILASTQDEIVKELEAGGSILHALEALLRLRQICAHPCLVPGLIKTKEFVPSSKLILLQETIEESLALGHNILIFSQWTSFLDLVEKILVSINQDFLRLDGSTRNRGALIEKFQDPTGPRVMILSLKAGGVGLTLTKADHVIILDPWWNPAVEDQAADRAHRIGQTQPVLVQRFVVRDTVEEKILVLKKKKQELAKEVLGHGTQMSERALGITRDDLMELLK